MQTPIPGLAATPRRNAALILVVLTGLGATFAASMWVADVADRQQDERFGALVEEALDAIHVRMEAYVATLRATRGLFVDGREPGRRVFREYANAMELSRHYAGIQGIGYTKFVPAAELARHVAAVRAEGFPNYAVWPGGRRDAYSAIVYIEPFDWRNQRAFGFDMFQEPTRRAAMQRARDTGEPAASARVELVQESGEERQPGFLIYVPVYSQRSDTLAQRNANLVGWVYAPFRAEDLLRSTLGPAAARAIDVEVFDGIETAAATQLFDGDPSRTAPGTRSRLTRLDVAGRPWTIRFSATPGLARLWERWLAPFVLAGGLALTALLFWIARGEARALERAEEAARRAAFLADAGRVLGSSLEYAQTLQRVADLAAVRVADGCVVYVDERGAEPVWALAHRDPAVVQRAHAELKRLATDPDVGAAAVVRRGRPVVKDVDPAAPARARSGLAELHYLTGARRLLAVPLFARGEALGAIFLLVSRPQGRFEPADVAMAEDLARLAVAAIDTGRLYASAQRSLRLRDEFLSIASHELKTPLTSLALQSDSLRAQAARAPDVVARKADAIRRNVERLGRLVETLLDLSRITADGVDLQLEETDLADVAHDVVARFDEEARRAGCVLRLHAAARIVGHWDRMRLDQVLTNLLANAVKYGSGEPIDVRVEAGDGRAILSVRDRGIGIADADQKRIFERFARAVSDRHYGGLGLGLWIVRRIVDALGGTIRVDSEPGQGATFTVELRGVIAQAERSEHGGAERPQLPA